MSYVGKQRNLGGVISLKVLKRRASDALRVCLNLTTTVLIRLYLNFSKVCHVGGVYHILSLQSFDTEDIFEVNQPQNYGVFKLEHFLHQGQNDRSFEQKTFFVHFQREEFLNQNDFLFLQIKL